MALNHDDETLRHCKAQPMLTLDLLSQNVCRFHCQKNTLITDPKSHP